jgi:hypothetical protein
MEYPIFVQNTIVIDQINILYNHLIGNGNDYYVKKENRSNIKVLPTSTKPNVPINFLLYKKSSRENDKLQFFIRRFYTRQNDPNRIFVVIYCNDVSTGELVRYKYYNSISDGSYWRYCILREDGALEKGYNYVSSTFVDINVQQFIYDNIHYHNITIEPINAIKCDPVSALELQLRERIMTKKYVSGNEFFNVINDIFPPVQFMVSYENCLKILKDKLEKAQNDRHIVILDICRTLLLKLHKYGISTGFNISGDVSRRLFYGKLKNVFSECFLHYFDLLTGTKKILFYRKFNVGKSIFLCACCSVDIVYKLIEGKTYTLYYMVYFGGPISDVPSKTILHIVPNNSKVVNIYGLNERYVSSGCMINKIFDYTSQTPITVLSGHRENTTANYRYIGDLTNYDFLPSLTTAELDMALTKLV